MTRKTIVFTGKEKLELVHQALEEPKAGELLVETTRTLISTGTETICYTRNFAPGTHWDDWVKYPFPPGYSHVGRVIAVGEGVQEWKTGDRVASGAGHTSHEVTATEEAVRI